MSCVDPVLSTRRPRRVYSTSAPGQGAVQPRGLVPRLARRQPRRRPASATARVLVAGDRNRLGDHGRAAARVPHTLAHRRHDVVANDWIASASSTITKNVETPSSSANCTSSSALSPYGKLSIRRIARGSRPARRAASSIFALPAARSPDSRYGRLGSQPSPLRRSGRACAAYAPIQICTGCGGGPRAAPRTSWCGPPAVALPGSSTARGRGSVDRLLERVDARRAQARAAHGLDPSQNAPAPESELARPPLSRRGSPPRATTAGRRSGTLRTLGDADARRARRDERQQRPCIEEARWYGWSGT